MPSITMKPMMPHQVRLRWPNAWRRQFGEIVVEARAIVHVITGSRLRCRVLRPEPGDQRDRGRAPRRTASAQGVKIEPMNIDRGRDAAMNGQTLGSALGSRRSGTASITRGQQQLALVDPQAVHHRQLARESHSGVRLSTTGICAKL